MDRPGDVTLQVHSKDMEDFDQDTLLNEELHGDVLNVDVEERVNGGASDEDGFVDAETETKDGQKLKAARSISMEEIHQDFDSENLSASSKNGISSSKSVDMTASTQLHQPTIVSHLSLIDLPSSLHSFHNRSQPDLAVDLSPPKSGRKFAIVSTAPVWNHAVNDSHELVKEEGSEEEPVISSGVVVTNTPATPQKVSQSLDALTFSSHTTRELENFPASSVDISPRGSASGSDIGGSPGSYFREPSIEKGHLTADGVDTQHEGQDNISRSSDSARSLDLSIGRSVSGDNRERKEPKGSGGSDKEKRKRSTLSNVFNPTYKSRSDEFKRLFIKELPAEERLLVDYSCALQRDILVHGRLYISPNYLCFYAKIFGWETNVALRFREVTCVTKEKTALVIPNAVQISTESEKYFFASFTSRDKTFLTIFRIWQMNLSNQPIPSGTHWKFIRSIYGEELGFTSEEEGDNVAQSLGDDASLPDGGRFTVPIDQAEDASAYCPTPSVPVLTPNGELDDSCIDNVETSALSLGDELQMSPTPKDSRLSSVSTFQTPKDTSSSPSSRLSVGRNSASRTRDRTGSDLSEISDSSEPDSPPSLAKIEIKADVPMPPPPICPISHDGKILIDCVLPFNVDQLFNMIFTASNFYLSFQAERKTTDLQANSWLPQDNGTKLRKISYTIQLASFGIKSCRTSENQVLLSHSQPGSLYSLDCEIQNSGIPYSDTFHVLSHFCLSRVSHSETNVVVSSHIKYKKSVWGLVKNFIEKNTWAGMEEYYSHLEKYLRAIPPPESADEDISRGSKKESGKSRRTAAQQRHRRLRTHSRGDLDTMISAIPLAVGVGSSPPSGNDGDSTKSTPAHRRRATADGPPIYLEAPKASKITSTWREPTFKFLAFVLMVLLIVNVLLFQRVGNLEVTVSKMAEQQFENYKASSDLPDNYEEWVSLLRQLEINHRKEVDRWKVVLESSSVLLKQTENSLSGLLHDMNKRIHASCEDHCDESRTPELG